MSDAPHRPEPEHTPSVEELERIAVPASIRRAPRFARVVGTGAVGGFLVGFICGMILPNSTGQGRATVGLIVGLGIGLLAGFIAGLVAVGLDRSTPAYLKASREREAGSASAGQPATGETGAEPEERQ